MSKKTVVVGGGIAGLGVAAELGRRGHPVTVVDADEQPGGHAAGWACMATGRCQRCGVCLVHDTLDSVRRDPMITLRSATRVTAARHLDQGFEVDLEGPGSDGSTLNADTLILATGFSPFDPQGSRPLGNEAVSAAVTTADLSRALRANDPEALGFAGGAHKRIAILQCIGSRDPEGGRPYCSQICCGATLNAARRLLEIRPDWEATLFYIDLQIHGKDARTRFGDLPPNLRLVQGVPAELRPPADPTAAALSLAYQTADGVMAVEDFQGAVMAVGMVPNPATDHLASGLGISTTVGGFLNAADPAPGLHAVGTCRGPSTIEGCLLQARNTAAKVLLEWGESEADVWTLTPPDRRLSAPQEDPVAPATSTHAVRRDVAVVGDGPEADTLLAALRRVGLPVTRVTPPADDPDNRVVELTGGLGALRLKLATPGGPRIVEAGAVVLASGYTPLAPKLPAALSSCDPATLDAALPPEARVALWLDGDGPTWRPVARRALDRAADLAEAGHTVSLIADHVALPGLEAQAVYDRARRAGARLFRPAGAPLSRAANDNGPPVLELRHAAVPEIPVHLPLDRLLLADTATPSAAEAEALGIRTDAEGFAQASNVRLAPLRTERPGVYAFASARRELMEAELLEESDALAAELRSLLASDELAWPDAAVVIDSSRCIRCLNCVRTCPHDALEAPRHELTPQPRALACEACGQCRVVCPALAIQDRDAPPRPPRSRVSHKRTGPYTPTGEVQPVTVFACRNSGAPALRAAQQAGLVSDANLAVVEVPCGGAIHELTVLGTLLAGGKRVALLTCHPDACAHHDGDRQCTLRIQRVRSTLANFGLPPSTVVHVPLSPAEPQRLAEQLRGILDQGGAQ